MKKYLMTGMAAAIVCAAFTSCSHDLGTDQGTVAQTVEETYEKAFITHFGQPASDRTWGFGPGASATRAKTRSIETPECPNINQPYDEDWVTEYLATAKEPNAENIADNYDNTSYAINYGEGGANSIDWNNSDQVAERDYFFSLSWEEQIRWALANKPNWLTYNQDETFVLNFKITQNYTGTITVAASEGYVKNGDEYTNIRQDPFVARTIVVKDATWTINENQRIGSGGLIVVADGGTINVTSGKQLEMVNHARLVVLSGGTITGEGTVFVTNGNGEGEENYNAGTIDVNHFNNNFGKFYNYGKFLVNEYDAGSTESNFYNHALVNIDHTGNTPNARIFNACQFYVQNDARLRIYEGVNGSALIVGGEFMPFGSADGTSVVSYVSLAEGALVKCNTLYNGSSWTGPTEGGYGALEIVDHIEYLTWAQDNPAVSGYFANNLYIKCGTWENDPSGQGKHYDGPINSEWDQINYDESRAEYKIWSYAANCTGNGNVTKVVDSDNVVWPADEDFILGEDGCTPGFKGDVPPEDPQEEVDEIAVLAEDLTINDAKPDFDFNDVVFKVTQYKSGTKSGQVWVTLLAAGGTLYLTVDGHEVHEEFAKANPDKTILVTTMINTAKNGHTAYKTASFQVTNPEGETIQEIANNIPVVVTKFGTPITLIAPTGGIPSKIAVKTDFVTDSRYGWCDEREDIDDKYNNDGWALFKSYVQGKLGDDWYTNINPNKNKNNQ